MSCCGEKRKAWLNNENTGAKIEKNTSKNSYAGGAEDQPDKLFEYIGSGMLTIVGSATGKSYTFKYKGDAVEVSHYDSFAMMAENDLRMLSPNKRWRPVSMEKP
jgi:hypothetical protein